MNLSDIQNQVIESPIDDSIFLCGPAGTGKTFTGLYRLHHLAESGVEGRKILLFFPQRNLGFKFQSAIQSPSFQAQSLPVTATYGGLARRVIDLFWPKILDLAIEFDSNLPPTFLTLETSLYFLSQVVEPLIAEKGYFSTVTIQRNRLYSQILDNLNKSAVHGFSHTEISQRLSASWIGDPAHEIVYSQAQEAANLFRTLCYRKNILDYSLQIELFTKAWQDVPLIHSYLHNQFSHLIYDNSEEDIPVAHDFIKSFIPQLSSCLIIYDEDAGYRSFLGASPSSAKNLQALCTSKFRLSKTYTTSDGLTNLHNHLISSLNNKPLPADSDRPISQSFSIIFDRYYPQMIFRVAEKTRALIDSGTSPGEIVVLAPYLNDSLRFLLSSEFEKLGIPNISHRPSRALRDEPVVNSLLTAAAIAHPAWDIHPSVYDLALSFLQIFSELDLTRSYLLAKNVLSNNPDSHLMITDFSDINPEFQDRISFYIGGKYQVFLDWISEYASKEPLSLDHFFSKMFGELLTRPDFGFYNDLIKGRITSQIIESFFLFRKTAASVLNFDNSTSGKEYYRMVKTGVLANQYLRAWTEYPSDKVLIAPAYTYLLANRPSDFQFWLDIGSRGWYERIFQPLTNPHILHRNWNQGDPWTDKEETSLNLQTLSCLVTGLVRRCRTGIFGCLTETDPRGFEQKGLLLQSLNRINSSVNDTEINGIGINHG